MDVSSTLRHQPLSSSHVQELVAATLSAEGVERALISVTFLGRAGMATMNREYLRRSGPTDVIAFAFRRDTPDLPVIGDIYICPDVAAANARTYGVSLREELSRLVIHGALHCLGQDHPEDGSRSSSRMWRRQERILAGRD